MDLKAVYHLKNTREGAHNTIIFTIDGGTAMMRKFCDSDIIDEFTEPPVETESEFNTDSFEFLKKKMKRTDGDDYEITVGKNTVKGNYDDLPDYLMEFQKMCGITPIIYADCVNQCRFSKSGLKNAFDKKIISSECYKEHVRIINESENRMKDAESMLNDRSYPFKRTPGDMISDLNDGMITDDQFNTFVRFRRYGGISDPKITRVKLKLSLWGQRLMGRYDTCEYILDDAELSERRYSVHGTLFEGCGNYKAPESAIITELEPLLIKNIFSFIQFLSEKGTLEKDYCVPGIDCSFFDLYVRFNDGHSIHTKGTTEYPWFIKFIMYMIGAKDLL